MNQVTTEQAVATYKATTKSDPRESWANWITAISNSLACGDWIGGDNYPQWVESAFNVLNAERTVSKADSN